MRLGTDLEKAVELQLANTSIPTLETYLHDLQVVINFMSTSEINLENQLQDHMRKLFPEGVNHRYLRDGILLSHTKHIWILLKYAQAERLLQIQNQVC